MRGSLAAAEEAGIERGRDFDRHQSTRTFSQTLRAEFGNGAGDVRVRDSRPERSAESVLCRACWEKNERLLVNRTIYEADIVLPIGCARLPDVAGGGVFDSLFPRLCDAETIGRLRTPSQLESAARLAAARRQTDKAGWLLGVPLVMQVVPGGDGTVADVVAGDPQAVAEHCQRLCQQLWSFRRAAAGKPGDCHGDRRPTGTTLGEHRPGAGGGRAAGRRRWARWRSARIWMRRPAIRWADWWAAPIGTAWNATCATTIRRTAGRRGNWRGRCSAGRCIS